MSDSNTTSGGTNQSQTSQTQDAQPERVFVQTDTSTNVSMQKGENSGPLTTKETE
jgi:hypothetical protein